MSYWTVVVDDETLSLTNVKNLLGGEDLKVSCLRSGRDLIKFMEKNNPDLILLDILMPDMDGFETYNALRKFEDDNNRVHIPVIFLTGENDSDTERKGLKLGASDFIRKPFNKDILIRRIHNTIDNSKTIKSLTEEANIDKLTGFLNKTAGTGRISDKCKDSTGTLSVLDLDNFKLVNDLFGHDMGDKVLSSFADIVRANTRETDIVSRIGGDEFLAFFMGMTEKEDLERLTVRLNDELTQKAAELMGEDNGIPLGISVGAVMIPKHGRDYESLFTFADSALYVVKQNGKHGCFVYGSSSGDNDPDASDLVKEMNRITTIVEERNDTGGALLLGKEAFSIIYRYVIRFYKRYGGSSGKILFALSVLPDRNDTNLSEGVAQFGLLLQNSLRRSDLILQSRANQFFVLLTERTSFEVLNVIERILKAWDDTLYGKDISIEYNFDFNVYEAETKKQ